LLLVPLALLVLQVRIRLSQVRQGLRVLKEFKVQQVLRELLVRVERLVLLDQLAHRVRLEIQVRQDRQVRLALRVKTLT
jgi:hypothetical protein